MKSVFLSIEPSIYIKLYGYGATLAMDSLWGYVQFGEPDLSHESLVLVAEAGACLDVMALGVTVMISETCAPTDVFVDVKISFSEISLETEVVRTNVGVGFDVFIKAADDCIVVKAVVEGVAPENVCPFGPMAVLEVCSEETLGRVVVKEPFDFFVTSLVDDISILVVDTFDLDVVKFSVVVDISRVVFDTFGFVVDIFSVVVEMFKSAVDTVSEVVDVYVVAS